MRIWLYTTVLPIVKNYKDFGLRVKIFRDIKYFLKWNFAAETKIRPIFDEYTFFIRDLLEQARKGFRPISASKVLLVKKVNDLINKRTEHWSCRIFIQ